MNRIDLQKLAEDRIADAAALLNAGRWSAAYYLAGYAVECALKACIAKQTQAGDFPDKRIAEKAKAVGVEKVAFDRSGFAYHGRVKALADAAREAGLQF